MQNGHMLPITAVAVHPELPIVATGSQDQTIILWNADTQKQLKSINIAQSVVSVIEFDGAGTNLLILTNTNTLLIYNLTSNKVIASKTFDLGIGYAMTAAFTKHPTTVAIGSNRDDLIFWNYQTNEETKATKGFSAKTNNNVLPSASSKYVSFDGAKGFYLIDETTKDSISVSFDKANNYQFNATGNRLAVGSNKLFASIFDTETGEMIQHIEPNPSVQCDGCKLKVAWHPNGKELATYDYKNGLYVWTEGKEKPLFSLTFTERMEYFFYSNTGRYILLSNDKEMHLVDTKSQKLISTVQSEFLNYFQPSFDQDEQLIYLPNELFSLQQLKISSGKQTAIFKGYNSQQDNQLPFDYLDWYDHGSLKYYKLKMPMEATENFVIFGKIGHDVQALDFDKGKVKTLFKTEKASTALAISPNDSLIAAGDAEGNIIVYNRFTAQSYTYDNVHSNMIFDLSFAQNNQLIRSCGWDGRTYEINLITGKQQFIAESKSSSFNLLGDGQNLYYFKSDVAHTITMYETDSHHEVKQFIGHTQLASDMVYSATSRTLYSAGQDGSVRIWDAASGLLESKFYLKNKAAALSIAKDPTGHYLYVGGLDKHIYIYDLKLNKLISQKEVHNSGIANIKFANASTIVVRGLDGSVKILNKEDLSERLSLFLYPDNEWLAVQPNGAGFEGTKNAMDQVHLVNETQSKGIGSLFNHYFKPGLLYDLLQGESLEHEDQGRNIDDLLKENISFDLSLQDGNKLVPPKEDSLYLYKQSEATIRVSFRANYKYEDIYIYNNGKLILTESSDEEIAFRGDKNDVILSIPLVPQQNKISIKVLDKNMVEHTHYPIRINYDTVAAKTDLYILSLGINQYVNKNYNLNYAKNDAQGFSSTLTEVAGSLYENVYTYSLLDKKVTKVEVTKLINEIAEEIGPEDVFVLYYAGHGVMLEGGKNEFYLVMSDVTNLYGGTEMMNEKGISSEELFLFSKSIPAQKQVYFLDACQSGAALDVFATRGVSHEKTIAQLARSSGTFFITASQDIEYANEASSLGHGLFTFAIIEILSGNAPNYADNILSMGELKTYVEHRVPELSEEYKTSPQYPTGYSFGNDFPIGVLDPE